LKKLLGFLIASNAKFIGEEWNALEKRTNSRLRSYLFHGSQVWEIVTGMEEQLFNVKRQ
jgi:hypothetical protein